MVRTPAGNSRGASRPAYITGHVLKSDYSSIDAITYGYMNIQAWDVTNDMLLAQGSISPGGEYALQLNGLKGATTVYYALTLVLMLLLHQDLCVMAMRHC